MKSRLGRLGIFFFICASVLLLGRSGVLIYWRAFPIYTSGVACVTDIVLNSVVPSVGGFVWSLCGR